MSELSEFSLEEQIEMLENRQEEQLRTTMTAVEQMNCLTESVEELESVVDVLSKELEFYNSEFVTRLVEKYNLREAENAKAEGRTPELVDVSGMIKICAEDYAMKNFPELLG
jgi:hypothetical protein